MSLSYTAQYTTLLCEHLILSSHKQQLPKNRRNHKHMISSIRCGPLALCICSWCTQRCPSRYSPLEAPQQYLQRNNQTQNTNSECISQHLRGCRHISHQAGSQFIGFNETHQWPLVVEWCTRWVWNPAPEHELSCSYWRYHFQWSTEHHSNTDPWELTL